MISSEVQRTLVKSPPELWAELGDPVSLARHLGELGEIRITRAEPEKLVEWEAEAASGTVAIKASGWGTRVTLTASREPSVPENEPEEQQDTAPLDTPTAAPEAPDPIAAEPDTKARPIPAPPEPAAVEPEPGPAAEPKVIAAPEPRMGFFARIFGRGRRRASIAEAPAEPEATVEPAQSEAASEAPVAQAEPESQPSASAEARTAPEPAAVEDQLQPTVALSDPAADLAAELKAAEENDVMEILKGVLDRLGAAHHRPFSRS
jgi:hypothetical protein